MFEAAPSRVPLTRKNFDALERRCNQLESLLRKLNHGINLEAELECLVTADVEGQDVSLTDAREDSPIGNFEWNETLRQSGNTVADTAGLDGLASVAAQSSGYLGIEFAPAPETSALIRWTRK